MEEQVDLSQERLSDFNLLQGTIEKVKERLGGEIEEAEGLLRLRDYKFESYQASLGLRLLARGDKGPCFAEFEEAVVMGVDLLHDKKINPLGARLLIVVNEKVGNNLAEVVDNLDEPLGEKYQQVVYEYLAVAYPEVMSDVLLYNQVLIDKMRERGCEVTKAERPVIRVLFPVSLETFMPILHELAHVVDEPEVVAQEWIQSDDLTWQMFYGGEEANEKIRMENILRKIKTQQENRTQKKALRWAGELFKRLPLPDYGRRLKWLDIFFRKGKIKDGLKGIIDPNAGGISHGIKIQ